MINKLPKSGTILIKLKNGERVKLSSYVNCTYPTRYGPGKNHATIFITPGREYIELCNEKRKRGKIGLYSIMSYHGESKQNVPITCAKCLALLNTANRINTEKLSS